MYKYWLCLLLGVCTIGMIQAQEEPRRVYPVKKGHLWGFIYKSKEIFKDPLYDAVGEEITFRINSSRGKPPSEVSYRLVELDGKLGVIDENLDEVLPCINDFILPVSATQFLVKQEEGYTVLDSAGINLPENHYTKLEFAGITKDGAHYYTIFDQNKKGIINAQGDTILPCNYASIEILQWQAAPFLIRTRANDKTWNLVAQGGKTLISEIVAAKSPHPGLLLIAKDAYQPRKHRAYDIQVKPIPALAKLSFESGRYLSPELVSLKQYVYEGKEGIQTLFQVRKQEMLLPQLSNFHSLNGSYCTASANRSVAVGRFVQKLQTLLTPQGEIIDTASWFQEIVPWEGAQNHYCVQKRGRWGVINQDCQEIIPTAYDSIGYLEDGLVTVRFKNIFAVRNIKGEVIVPAEYIRIRREDKELWGIKDRTNATIYELNDSLQVVSVRESENPGILSVGASKFHRIANSVDFSSHQGATAASRSISYTSIANTSALNAKADLLQRDLAFQSSLSRLFDIEYNEAGSIKSYTPSFQGKKIGIDSAFLAMYDLSILRNWSFISVIAKKATSPTTYLKRLFAGQDFLVKPQRFLADDKLSRESFLGFRMLDFREGWHYVPALAENGRFFLLNKDAESLRGVTDSIMEFTFVGAANNGLLRVCIGGELDLVSIEETGSKESLPMLPILLTNFFLQLTNGKLNHKDNKSLIVRSLPGDRARWGVLDTLGHWVIPPVYDYLEENINGQMVARKNGYYGVIDSQGDTIVDFEYLHIKPLDTFWRVNTSPLGEVYINSRGYQILDIGIDTVMHFREGYAAYLENDRWSYIDNLGSQLGEANFLKAKSFGEGLAAVQLDSTQWSFIDTSGQLHGRLPIESYHDIGYFSEGRCWFRRENKFGFLDRSLREVIPARFRPVSSKKDEQKINFDRGRAIVRIGPGVAIIDTSGNILLEPIQYSHLTPWNEAGLAVATLTGNNKKYLVDLDGNPLHQEPFDDIKAERGPFYPFMQGSQWGYLDGEGKEVIPPSYATAMPFADERARVKISTNGRWTYINPAGRSINRNRQAYDQAKDFSEGLAFVKNDNDSFSQLLMPNGQERTIPNCDVQFVDGLLIGCGQKDKETYYVDHNGNKLFLGTYDEITPFGSREMAFVRQGSRWGVIDRRGMLLVNCKYLKYKSRPDGIFQLGPPAFGIFDRDGNEIVPPKYDNLELMEKGVFRVERGEMIGYWTVRGREIWPLQN